MVFGQRFTPWLRENAERFEHFANGKPWTEEEIAEIAEAYTKDLHKAPEQGEKFKVCCADAVIRLESGDVWVECPHGTAHFYV
jgi:hypothetical protein